MTRKFLVHTVLAGALVLTSQSAGAQITTIDLLAGNGGFTTSHLAGANNPWAYTLGTGWAVGQSSTVSYERLLSPVFTATQSAFGLVLSHAYNFEGNCFDGGQVRVSVNGGAFNLLTPSGGYTSTVSNGFGSPIGGQAAFCGNSGAISTTFTAASQANDTYQFAFDAAWDNSVQTPAPNWKLTSIELRDLSSNPTTVPEPSTYALMAAGLLALGAVSRRKRTA